MRAPEPLRAIPFPRKSFRLVAIDLKKTLQSGSKTNWLAVAVFHSAKFVEAAAPPDKAAEPVTGLLFREAFARRGYVRRKLSDCGGENCNEIPPILAEKLGMCRRFERPYYPQDNGARERTVGDIAGRIAKSMKPGPSDSARLLPAARMAMRGPHGDARMSISAYGLRAATISYLQRFLDPNPSGA